MVYYSPLGYSININIGYVRFNIYLNKLEQYLQTRKLCIYQ